MKKLGKMCKNIIEKPGKMCDTIVKHRKGRSFT
jgi:hypothetical protein